MGQAELMFHFLTAMKLLTRARQMQGSLLISSIGSFLVEKGQKTILEELNEDMLELDRLLGVSEEEKKQSHSTVFDSLISQMSQPKTRKR
ncbi:MAG: hypothetical protein V2A69_15935 [Pseudomonadota bacterium]